MRQLWIAVAILGGMLALTAWNVTVMHQQVQPIVEELHQAAAAAREEDWPQAETPDPDHPERSGRNRCPTCKWSTPTNTPMRPPSPSRPRRGPLASRSPGGVCHRGSPHGGHAGDHTPPGTPDGGKPVIGMKNSPPLHW